MRALIWLRSVAGARVLFVYALWLALVVGPFQALFAMSVSFTGDASNGNYTVSWSSGHTYQIFYRPMGGNGHDIYELHERVNGGTWTVLSEWNTSSVSFTGKAAGTYEYKLVWRVLACFTGETETHDPYVHNDVAEQITVTVPAAGSAPSAPGTPTGPTTTQYDGAYTISWTAVTGATRYELDERLGSTGTWEEIYDGANTSHDLTGKGAGTWQYRVRAANASGTSSDSGTKSVTVAVPAAPSTPTGPTGTEYDGAYTISWNTPTGATRYELDERLGSTGTWSEIHDGTDASKAVTGKSAGTWQYRARACSAVGCSGDSGTKSVTVAVPAAPSAPTGPTGTDTDGAYTISWSAVTGATRYELDERLGSTGTWSEIHDGATRSKAVSGKADGTWQYRVRACSAVGCSTDSGTKSVVVEVVTVPDAPSTPTGPTTTQYDGAYTINWSAVSGATRYELDERQGSTGTWEEIYDGSDTSKALTGKGAGTWQYRVRAANSAGTSSDSGTKSVTVAVPAAPSAPTGPTGTDTDGAYTISWSAVTGATRYELDERLGSTGTWEEIHDGATRSKSVSGKTDGTWQYRVRACSAVGCSSDSSTKSVVVVLVTVPDAPSTPTGPTTTQYDGAYTISWSAVTGATRYELDERKGSTGTWTEIYDGSDTSKALTGKGAGTWQYRVRAANSAGTSSDSGTKSVTVATPAAPSAPTGPTTTQYDGEYTISWTSVTGATRYALEERKGSTGTWTEIHDGATRSKAVTGKSAGTWQYQVKACSAVGCSSFSGTKSVTVSAPSAPSTPTGPTGTDTDGAYTISWSAVTGATRYELDERLGSTGTWVEIHDGATRSKSVSSKADGTWQYRVRACSAVGCSSDSGTKSVVVAVVTVPGTPGTPTGPTTTQYDGAYTISWSAVTGATRYELDERKGSTGTWTEIYDGSDTSKALTGKGAGTWQYRVRAANSAGTSSDSGTKSVTVATPAAPSAPTGPTTTQYDGEYTISWTSVTGATRYALEERKGSTGTWEEIHDGAASSKAVTGKSAGTWQYRARACSAVGCSSDSGIKSVTVAVPAAPATPTGPTGTEYDGAYTISWSTVTGATRYELDERLGNTGTWKEIHDGTDTSKDVTDKSTGTWQYRARACSAAGCSGSSGTKSVTVSRVTPPVTPNAPSGPSTTQFDGAYFIWWRGVSGATSYTLQERLNDGEWKTIQTGSSTSRSISGKTAGTWHYRVRAENAGGNSDYSGTESITVAAPSAPSTPSGPSSTDTDGDYFITWSSRTGATKYVLEERLGSTGTWAEIHDGATRSKRVTLRASGTWQYRVKACSVVGCGDWSRTKSVVVELPDPPPVPTSLRHSGSGGSYLVLWGISTGATRYVLQEKPASGIWTSVYDGSLTFASLTGRSAGTYSYQARACIGAACSAWSTSYSVTVSDTPQPPSPPPPSTSTAVDVTDSGDPSGFLKYVPPSGSIPGLMPGQYSVNRHGGFNYEIPIQVPPGTAGMEPELSLRYDSHARNGLLGVGWRLSGISRITRCRATEVNDDYSGGISFDSNDRFCLDGQRLIAVSGTYGANNTEYRTEVDRIRKVVSYGTAGSGPQYFKVWNKNGHVTEYGNTADSRIEAVGKTDVLVWTANKLQDSSGNYLTYRYTEDSTNGDHRINRIDYTGHAGVATYSSVRFSYEARTDQPPEYYDGSKHKIQQRLTHIKTYSGTALVMDYRIAYDNAGAAGRSRITSVKACDSAENCMEPTEFSWQSGGSGSYPSATTATLSTSDLTDYETFAEDLDGDGLSDILATKIGSTGFFSRAALRNANGTFGTLQSDTLSTASQSGYVSYFGDLDADGHLDLVAVLADSSGLRVKTALGTGTGTFSNLSSVETLYRTRDLTDYVVWVRDMNNDGYDDIILSLLSYGLYIGVALGDGDGTFQALTYGYYTTFRDGRFAGIGDVDGDRIGDVAIIYTRDRFLIDVISGDGDGTFANAIRTTAGAAGWSGSQAFLEDVNGDGLSDVVLTLAEDEDGSDGGMQYGAWFSEGDGTFDTNGATQQLWSSDASAYEDHAVEDINADGYPDLIYAKKDTSGLELKAAVGNGDGTFGSITTSSVSTTYMLNYAIRATDADGDGLTDVVVANADSTGLKVYTSQASGNRPDLITQVVDGYDVDTDIAYAPITDDGVYTKGSSATYPAMDVQDASHVVKSVVTDNGTGGRRTTNYKYQGAQVHLEGRGWLGFSAMEATETAYSPDIVTRTNYSLAFPYIGMVTSMERRLTSTSGRKLQTYEATLANLTTMTGKTPKFPYVSSGVTKTYDLAKALLNTETLVSTETVAETYKTGLTGTYPTFANLETLKVTRTGGAKTFVTHHKYQHTDERTAGWLLGRITRQEITEYLHGYSGATDGTCSATSTTCDKRTTNFVYDTDEWLVTQEVLEPDNAEWKLTSTNTYDTHGNLDSVAVSGGSSTHETNITSRTTDPRWDARGQFMNRLTNAKSHHTTYATDAKFGVVTTETDPNGDSTVRTYDTFGRLTRETRPGGSVTNVYRAWCTSATCPTDGKTKEVTTVSGQPAQAVIYDALGRETLRATVAWTADSATAANIAVVDTQYDTLGNVWKRSRPYFHNATPVWHVFQYDVLHRQTRETAPGSRATSTVYAGLQSTVTNAKSQDTKYTRNVRGELVAVEDEDENSIAYTYDPFGNLLTTVDSENNTTTNTYNIRGFRESTRDPDAGLIDYEYNVLGELVEQTDAKSQTIAFVYDVLGRMTERDDIEGTGGVTTWTYDTATNGKGRIHTVDGSEGDDHTYTYDGSGRLTRHRTTIDSTNYDLNYTYDSSSRLDTLQYPASARHSSGLTVRYNYTDEGHLEDVRNTAGNALFWEIDGAGADGQLTGETFGNDVSSVRRYDANTGFLTDIESGEATATDRQNERYEWDKLGNLTKRYDDLQSLSETFAYDGLNRLTSSTVTGQTAKTYTYDDIGNLTKKSDVSAMAYTYGARATGCTQDPGPHAVSTASGQPFCYDANGNMTKGYNFRSSRARTYAWTTYNKPSRIVEGATTLTFSYGADRRRFKQVSSGGLTTLYVAGGLFEKRTRGTTTTEVHHIQVQGRAVAVYTSLSSTTQSVRYLHGDHLGSIVLVTDEDGDVEGNRYSFDAFGRRRNGANWTDTLTTLTNPDTTRGYTGHDPRVHRPRDARHGGHRAHEREDLRSVPGAGALARPHRASAVRHAELQPLHVRVQQPVIAHRPQRVPGG